jgi:hypothetical protein
MMGWAWGSGADPVGLMWLALFSLAFAQVLTGSSIGMCALEAVAITLAFTLAYAGVQTIDPHVTDLDGRRDVQAPSYA